MKNVRLPISRNTRYLNTDLDLEAPFDLASLAQALCERGLYALHVTAFGSKQWCAAFETDTAFDSPDKSVTALLAAIEQLRPEEKQAFCDCSRREFNIGYEGGDEPLSLSTAIDAKLLGEIAALSASLRITIYAPER